jgi:hypothetical protein
MTDKKNKPSRLKRKPEDLRNASGALYYELWMLNECVRLDDENKNSQDKPLKNAFIESFCVHARNLLDFFCDPNPLENDIYYKDFLKINPNNEFTPSFTIDLKVTNENLNVYLSHLSHKRINKKIKWEISKITNEINKNMRVFLKAVNPSLICDKLKEYMHGKVKKLNDITTICATTEATSGVISVTKSIK